MRNRNKKTKPTKINCDFYVPFTMCIKAQKGHAEFLAQQALERPDQITVTKFSQDLKRNPHLTIYHLAAEHEAAAIEINSKPELGCKAVIDKQTGDLWVMTAAKYAEITQDAQVMTAAQYAQMRKPMSATCH